MRTHQTDDRIPARRVTRTTAPHPWASAAWATDSRLANWPEMDQDGIDPAPSAPVAAPGSSGSTLVEEDKPITAITLGCLVLAALVSGTLVFSLMRVLLS